MVSIDHPNSCHFAMAMASSNAGTARNQFGAWPLPNSTECAGTGSDVAPDEDDDDDDNEGDVEIADDDDELIDVEDDLVFEEEEEEEEEAEDDLDDDNDRYVDAEFD